MALANQGVAPFDPTTPVGQVRLLIGDTDPTEISGVTGAYVWVSDKEIEGYLGLYTDPRRAAIFILRLVAMTPSMQYKKWSSADLSVDGPAITAALRALIADIEKSIATEDAVEIADFVGIVSTGAAITQPAFFSEDAPTWRGEPLDPTLPLRIL